MWSPNMTQILPVINSTFYRRFAEDMFKKFNSLWDAVDTVFQFSRFDIFKNYFKKFQIMFFFSNINKYFFVLDICQLQIWFQNF